MRRFIQHTTLFIWGTLFTSVACNTTVDVKPVEENAVQEPLSLTLVATVSSDTALAGDSVNYTVEVQDQSGTVIERNLTWGISSDIEADLHTTTSTLMPVVSGSHTLTVQAVYTPTEEDFVSDEDTDGIVLEQNFTLEVDPLGVEFLDLQVDKGVAQAGENVPYRVWALDRFGNRVQDPEIDSVIELSADSPDLTIATSQIYSTIADVYGVSAWYGEIGDTEFLEVVPDGANSITLVVPEDELEKYDSVQCDVIVEDRFGNRLDNEWNLWTEGMGVTTVSHNIVTFLDEGYFTLYANTYAEDGTELVDSHGPILIDSSGPSLFVNTPARGTWTEDVTTTVSGTVIEEYSLLNALLVNGLIVQPEAAGTFNTETDLNEGVTVIETDAIDSDGNISNDARAVLSGNFEPKDEGIEDAIQAYLGSNGINSLEDNLEDIVGNINLSDVLPANPLASQGVAWCTAYVNVNNLSYGNIGLDIDPQSNGYIKLTMTLPNIDMDLDVPLNGGSWWQPCPDFSGSVSASSVTAEVLLNPYVSNNQVYTSIASSSSNINGLNVSLSGWGSVLNFIVNLFEGTIADLLEDEVSNVLSNEVPPLLNDFLQSLELVTSFDLMGTLFTLEAYPSSIFADNHGLGFGLETNVTADGWSLPNTGLGSFAEGYAAPTFASNSGYNIALSTDVINQLLYQVWGSGFMSQELSLSELGVSGSDIEVLFPNSSDLRITIEPMLPPIVTYDAGALNLEMGELYLAVHNGDYSAGDIRLEIYTHIFAPIDMTVNATSILATVGEPNTYFDVVYPSEGARGTETLLGAVIPMLLPTFTDAISEIPLPSFSGVTLSNINSGVDNGHLTLTGNVSF